MERIYPESKVEIQGFTARKYDQIMNVMSLGLYDRFIRSAIARLQIQPADRIIDLGCGTGRNACLMRHYLNESGSILGLDISSEMETQFRENCQQFPNVSFRNQRIDTRISARDSLKNSRKRLSQLNRWRQILHP